MSGGGSEKTSTKTEPWSGQKPYLQDLFAQAQQLFNQGGIKAYGGPTVAAPGAATVQGQQAAQGTANAATTYANTLLKTRPGMSPSTLAMERATVAPLYQQLTESALPAIRGESMATGMYGSNRQGIAEGLATGRTAEAAGHATAAIGEAARQQDLEAQGRALALTPTLQGAQVAVGHEQDAYRQQLMNEAIQRYYYNQTQPYSNLAQYQQYITGGYGSNVSQNAPGTSPLMTGMSGALTGAAIGGMTPAGPLGAGIGAGIGGAAGLLMSL